jgi:radical SAM superfamily enzyme YgiQ (UPF0313 family)
MFKEKKFHVRPMEDILDDIDMARKYYRYVNKIFLCDGDALCLSTSKLLTILDRIAEVFPECERVGVYGSPKDVLRKRDDELQTLKEHGLDIIYIGAESGSDIVLRQIDKGATREEIITAVKRIEAADIMASVTFISGLGGKPLWREHAIETGTMISEMGATYVGLLTLLLEPGAPMREDVIEGRFELLSAEEIVAETLLMMKNINVDRKCVFRSNHASNYVSLRGDLPDDKDRMIAQLERAMEDTGLLKDERFRAL